MKQTNKKNADKLQNKKALYWIASVSKPHIAFVVFLVLLNGVAACFGSASALLSKEVIDSAVDGAKSALFMSCVMYVILTLLQVCANVAIRYYTEKCRAKLDIVFKKRLFSQQLSKLYPDIRAFHSGDLVNRLTGDVSVITDAVTTIPANIASVAVRLICAFSVLIVMQWQFAVVFAIGGALIFSVTRLLRDKIKQYHKDMQKADGKVRSFWQEVTENLLVVKAFASEESSCEKSDALLGSHYGIRMRKAKLGAASSGANHAIMRIGYLFALIWCSVKLLNSKMSFGTLTAITSLVGQVQMPFANLSGIMPRYYAALSSAERIMEIEQLEAEENTDEGKLSDVSASYSVFRRIVLSDMNFAYDSDTVLENVNLSINKGDFVSVTGASGIGKSTLFKLLLNIYPVGEGKIEYEFDGFSMPCSPEVRKMFAYVPQGNLLFSGTIRENLEFLAGKCDDEKIHKALEIACADSFMEQTQNGLDTVIGEGGLGLSEGQIQRLAVARALLSNAPILLLDEATSALDEQTEAKMLYNIKSLTDKTCLIVTHKKAALDICTRHFVMKDRHLFESEKPESIEV